MAIRRMLTVLGAALVSVSCADVSPVEDTAPTSEDVSAVKQSSPNLLNDIPVTGTLAGGTFTGLLDITQLALANGQLVAYGLLTGTATQGGIVTVITQTFSNVPLDLDLDPTESWRKS